MMTEATNFNYYEADNVYGTLFFQFPKVLMYGEKYKHLSSDAKLAYMILKDRLEYSLRNNWVDEDNHIYFIFTNQELVNLFNCSEHKVIKVKTELESIGLLFQKQMGFNPKTKKNEPNRLYLSKLDVKATDVYLRSEYGKKAPQSLATSGTAKSAVPHKSVDSASQTLATSGTAKSAVNLDREPKARDKDRYKIDTQKLDFSTANFSPAEIETQNRDLVKHADEFLTDPESGWEVCLEPEAIQLLSFWCRTPQQMRRFIRIILNAKNNLEKEHQALGVKINLGDDTLKPLITKTLRRYFNVLRSNEKHVKDVENYLYGTMTNLFGIYWNKLAGAKYRAQHSEEFKNQGVISD